MPYISLKAPRPVVRGLLTFELIPKSSWGINVRSELSKKDWDLLRKWVYQRAGYVCEICGGVGPEWPVECHEKWVWDDNTGEQILVDLVALCPKCHAVKHLGYSRSTLSKSRFQRLLSHQRRVNRWSKIKQVVEWDAHCELYRARCNRAWSVDISYARSLVFKIKKGVV